MKKLMKQAQIVALTVFCLFALLILAAKPQFALAETKTFPVTADAWVSSQFPTQNYGGGSYLFILHDSNDGRAYFNFDLISLPAHSTITQARLIVWSMGDSQDCTGNPTTFTTSLANSSWAENNITWNNKPGSAADHNNWMSCYNGWSAQDVAPLVQNISDGTKTNYGFFMFGSGTSFKRTLISKESSASHPAALELIFTPPAAPPAPSGQPADSGSNTGSTATGTTTGIIAGSKAAPAAKTSAAIKPAKELVVKDATTAETLSIDLTWQKSDTTNIDGYKIFRSEKETEGFENIAIADKNTLTYIDPVSDGKTFYYFVRAYKGSEESASSNTAGISAKKIVEEKAPIIHSQKYRDWIIIAAAAAGVIVLTVLALLFFKVILPKIRARKSQPQ